MNYAIREIGNEKVVQGLEWSMETTFGATLKFVQNTKQLLSFYISIDRIIH